MVEEQHSNQQEAGIKHSRWRQCIPLEKQGTSTRLYDVTFKEKYSFAQVPLCI
jgi:hypothetical protein